MPIEAPALGPLLGNTVNMVISPFYTLFSTNATYCFTARTNVRNHKTETEDLKGKLHSIKQRITDGEMNGLIPTEEAKDWVRRAEQAISEEAANRESFHQRCRIFGCSLNCWGNYKTSKKAAEKVDAVRKYISSALVPDNVTRIPPPPPVVDLSTHSAQLLPSRGCTLRSALRCIKEEDAVRVIGIWGPRGVGKTHLLTKINNSFLEHCPFDIVILIKATSECTVQKVQAQIINRFCINQNVDVTAQIYELLKKRSFLVLVDDLCEKLDLSAVGIPHPLGVVDQKKRKVLIISRSQSICDLMSVDKYIQVLGLEEEEAHQQFEQSFGDENLYNDPNIGVLAKKLVGELMGLPSELIHFGNTMQRRRNAREWQDVIDAVKTSKLQKDIPLCMAERIVRNLEDCTEDLLAKRDDVCQKIENAEREGKTSTYEVKKWLEKVAKIINVVRVISVDCKLKKDVTMEASEKLREVQECLGSCPSTVAIESMPSPVQEMPGSSMSAEDLNLQEALHLIKDEPTVGMIGIWGPGGVGKTHLLRSINNSFGEGMDFNFVLFVTASRGCSVEKVQSQIIERLRLPSSGSKSRTIYEYMKTKSFLVLLDDLWDEIDLEDDVGIPYPLGSVNNLNRKVVLTTRLRKVCAQMKVKKEVKVAYLQEHEAWQLFEKIIGAETLSSPHIKDLARELMKELKGLPLALINIGKAMYQKNEYQWETAIQCMKQSCCADDKDPIKLVMETNVFKKLKLSYDNLRNGTLRACFLTCVLWPENALISKVDLAKCWMGLGLVNEPDIESSFRKSYSLIADLTAACLLDGCEYNDEPGLFRRSDVCVKVHDVIRDMALWISCDCGEKNDKWIVATPGGRDQKVIMLSNNVECISLMSITIPIRFNLDPLNLRILCLPYIRLDESIFVEAIKNCSSLTYLDLRGNKLKRIPEELFSLVKLEYLDLSRNRFHPFEMPHSFGKLINLKFLYLMPFSSGDMRIPAGVISSLQALQVIDLRGYILRKPSLHELGTLPRLKALGAEVRGRVVLESLLGEAANLPVRYLNMQSVGADLTGILSTDFAQRTLYDLDIEDGDTREITVEHDTEQPNTHFGALNRLNLSMMISLREIMWMGATPAFIFPRLTCLELLGCTSLSHLSWAMYLPRLEELCINHCSGMVQAFMRCHGDKLCNGQDKTKTFPCLRFLSLSCNMSLEAIGDKGMEFPSLERLEIEGCPKLKRLPFQLDSLPPKLKELWFKDAKDWERLECEEDVKGFLQPLLKFDVSIDDSDDSDDSE